MEKALKKIGFTKNQQGTFIRKLTPHFSLIVKCVTETIAKSYVVANDWLVVDENTFTQGPTLNLARVNAVNDFNWEIEKLMNKLP